MTSRRDIRARSFILRRLGYVPHYLDDGEVRRLAGVLRLDGVTNRHDAYLISQTCCVLADGAPAGEVQPDEPEPDVVDLLALEADWRRRT